MKIDSNMFGSGIDYVCFECGEPVRRSKHDDRACTMHQGECDVCGKVKALTHVRHFGFPEFEVEAHIASKIRNGRKTAKVAKVEDTTNGK